MVGTMRPRTALLALLVVTTVVGPAVPVTASPQPTPICPVCSDSIGWTDTADGLNLSMTASTAKVRIHPDGSATWTVTNHLSNETTVGHLRADPARLDALVNESLQQGQVKGAEGAEGVETTLARDGTMTVTFRDPDAARHEVGTLVVEYLHSRGSEAWLVVNADRFSVVGPANSTVVNHPPGATVDGRRATWRGDGSDPAYEAPIVEQDAYVVFAPENATLSGVRADAATLVRTTPIVTDVVVTALFPPVALFGLLLAVVALGVRWTLSRNRFLGPSRSGALLAGIGVLVLTHAIVGALEILGESGRVELAVGPLLLVAGGVGVLPAVRRWATTPRRLLVVPLVALPLVVLLGAALSRSPDPGTVERLRDGVCLALGLAPLALAVPFGAALRRGGAGLTFAGVLVAFLAAELTVVWPTQRPSGLVAVLFIAYAAGVALGALPLAVYGGLMAEQSPEWPSAATLSPVDD